LVPHTKRFAGLDAIRFVCAYAVTSAHNPSSLAFARELGPTAEVIAKILRDSVNGPAAVIVFFIISGFCIHLPYRAGQPIGIDYFVRRYLRIGIPLCAALLISPLVGIPAGDLVKSVLWSLYCELVYYSIYPLLRGAATRVGWLTLTALAFLLAFSWAIVWPSPWGSYTTANVFRDSVIGLPCWLMGCLLAEREPFRVPSTRGIWLWRGAVFIASVSTLELHFHTRVRFAVSLNVFAILVFFWLSRELGYGQKHLPWSWLERAGAWSYSLYVLHPAAGRLQSFLFPSWPLGVTWLLRIPLTLLTCYAFYRAVEKPSHRLARAAANALRSSDVAGVPPLA